VSPNSPAQACAAAGMLLKRLGATFRLNDSGSQGVERILPFDPLPRLITASEWQRLEQGLIQRLEAIDRWCHISGLDLVRDGAGT
jgi:uncharacterized circularly permuted ATP-grasp superfamily protein